MYSWLELDIQYILERISNIKIIFFPDTSYKVNTTKRDHSKLQVFCLPLQRKTTLSERICFHVFLHPISKEATLEGKNLLPWGLPLRLSSFKKGGNYFLVRVSSHGSVFIHLNITVYWKFTFFFSIKLHKIFNSKCSWQNLTLSSWYCYNTKFCRNSIKMFILIHPLWLESLNLSWLKCICIYIYFQQHCLCAVVTSTTSCSDRGLVKGQTW